MSPVTSILYVILRFAQNLARRHTNHWPRRFFASLRMTCMRVYHDVIQIVFIKRRR